MLMMQKATHALFASMTVVVGLATVLSPASVAAGSSPSDGSSAFVLFNPGSGGADMSGSMEDLRRAKSLRVDSEGLLYVREGGAAYVIRDAATLRRAKSFFEPEEALGARQNELGSHQTALGEQQSKLGTEQAVLSKREANSSHREATDLGRQEQALSSEEEALGRQQEALGRRQEELGREQSRVSAIAAGQVMALFHEALRLGLAHRFD
jgi:hypothetical protein